MQQEVHLIRSQIESNMTMNNDSNLEKIAFLQKCILKMERLFQKAERENFKQVLKLKRELEYRDKSNQVKKGKKTYLLAISFGTNTSLKSFKHYLTSNKNVFLGVHQLNKKF